MRNGSWIDATNLKAEDVRIRNNSVMDSKIYVSNELKAFLNTHGNIYYQGDPEKIIIEEQSSKGKLIPLK